MYKYQWYIWYVFNIHIHKYNMYTLYSTLYIPKFCHDEDLKKKQNIKKEKKLSGFTSKLYFIFIACTF